MVSPGRKSGGAFPAAVEQAGAIAQTAKAVQMDRRTLTWAWLLLLYVSRSRVGVYGRVRIRAWPSTNLAEESLPMDTWPTHIEKRKRGSLPRKGKRRTCDVRLLTITAGRTGCLPTGARTASKRMTTTTSRGRAQGRRGRPGNRVCGAELGTRQGKVTGCEISGEGTATLRGRGGLPESGSG